MFTTELVLSPPADLIPLLVDLVPEYISSNKVAGLEDFLWEDIHLEDEDTDEDEEDRWLTSREWNKLIDVMVHGIEQFYASLLYPTTLSRVWERQRGVEVIMWATVDPDHAWHWSRMSEVFKELAPGVLNKLRIHYSPFDAVSVAWTESQTGQKYGE
jgi:hypothetical protein